MHLCMHPCSMYTHLSENMALEQVVRYIVAHVDTVGLIWGMQQVYTRKTLKSKDVTNLYRLNCLDSLNYIEYSYAPEFIILKT